MLFKQEPTVKTFPYNWKLSDIKKPAKSAPTVFSTFCGAGGSSLGYKLAGYRSIGGNDLDKKQSKMYRHNLKPEYFYEGFISDLVKQPDLPPAMYSLDVLDGSPPCSLFSTVGVRDKGWGKEKHFREGQAAQVLDTLFWDLIDVAAALKPKVVIAENVAGILAGRARDYVQAITRDFKKAGYIGQWYLIKGENVGLPQRRWRVFYCGLRADLVPRVASVKLKIRVNASPIPFSVINTGLPATTLTLPVSVRGLVAEMRLRGISGYLNRVHPRGSFFCYGITPLDKPCYTVTAYQNLIHPVHDRYVNIPELLAVSSWPTDYDWMEEELTSRHVCYGVGMSVPPIMCATVASAVKDQWLKYLK